MSNDDIPWDELFEGEIAYSTANIAGIMRGYCENIEKSSGGVVHARFDELKMETRVTGGVIHAASLLLPRSETYQVNALSQMDINELYEPSMFVFDIYNDTYQFRLCDLSYGATYPVEVEMDEGVHEEIAKTLDAEYERRDPDFYVLDDDDDLRSCFRLMFMSRKVRAILLQLRQG